MYPENIPQTPNVSVYPKEEKNPRFETDRQTEISEYNTEKAAKSSISMF